MFDRLTADGVAWDDGREVKADVILWATGFRHALDHLAPLHLRNDRGGITMDGTQVATDPRIHLLGYGPSASTIGATRAARVAVRDLRERLGHRQPA
jgi:NAD(P)H-nitrite reductase large subunit